MFVPCHNPNTRRRSLFYRAQQTRIVRIRQRLCDRLQKSESALDLAQQLQSTIGMTALPDADINFASSELRKWHLGRGTRRVNLTVLLTSGVTIPPTSCCASVLNISAIPHLARPERAVRDISRIRT
jgi:hypothetical protein